MKESKYVKRIPDPVRTVTTYAEKIKYPYETDETGAYVMEKYPIQQRTRNIVLRWFEVRDQVRAVFERGEHWDTQPSGDRHGMYESNLYKLYQNPDHVPVWDWTT